MIRYDGTAGSLLSALDFDTGDSEEHSAVAVGPDGNPGAGALLLGTKASTFG
jgi:hypothetical protein